MASMARGRGRERTVNPAVQQELNQINNEV
jgi:hypothetical protein